MRVSPHASIAGAWSTILAQTTCRVGAHRSSPTARPVPPPDPVSSDTVTRRPSRHTFDIRV